MNACLPDATGATLSDQATIGCLREMGMGQLRDILTSSESPAVRTKALYYFELLIRRDQLNVIMPRKWQIDVRA